MAAVLTDRSGLVLRLYSLKMSRYIVNWQHMPSICSLCLKKRAFYGRSINRPFRFSITSVQLKNVKIHCKLATYAKYMFSLFKKESFLWQQY